MKKFWKRLLYSCLSLALLLNVVVAFHAWKFTHFFNDTSHRNKRPEEMSVGEKAQMMLFGIRISKSVTTAHPDVPYETVRLKTKTGLHLEGWWIPTPNATGTVIVLHGYLGNKGAHLAEAMWFRQLGYNVYLQDFRGHGNSDGYTCSIGYYESEDVKLAWDYVTAKTPQPVVLWGMSMGAAAIMKAVPEYHLTPQKIILEAPYATLTDAVKSRMRAVHLPPTPFSQLLTFWGGVEQGFWGFSLNPQDYARKLTMPVLHCWGQQDIRVLQDETKRVYAALASSRKQLQVFKKSGHQSFCRNEPEIWKPLVKRFLKQ
ncbi:alpha/beta hydrolase [Chitinophaga solisilvae]|uniref:alpha/beta hydrolase n=1 Tax=Chitinophaga solisilvae TaxID=1233460 RepID=UPI0013691D8A|nr:alpha/beta fold hydrolase [Chitinophaga solisilvae]